MHGVTTIGLDIAKSVFQVHGIDAIGKVVIRRQLKRRYVLAFFEKLPPCLVGIEACASSHHWARALTTLGHTVRLMPPVYVKPYVKRQKNDAADAEAICEAVTRGQHAVCGDQDPRVQGSHVLPLFGAMAPQRRLSVRRGAVLLELSPSRMRDSGWDQFPPDVRFAGEACRNESPALDRSLSKSALDGETIM